MTPLTKSIKQTLLLVALLFVCCCSCSEFGNGDSISRKQQRISFSLNSSAQKLRQTAEKFSREETTTENGPDEKDLLEEEPSEEKYQDAELSEKLTSGNGSTMENKSTEGSLPEEDSSSDEKQSSEESATSAAGGCSSGKLFHVETGKCYKQYKQGPCGVYMVLRENHTDAGTGICVCEDRPEYCSVRPLIHWKPDNICYHVFHQGPCKTGEWLILNKNEESECQVNPCLNSKSEQPFSLRVFDFVYNQTCHNTKTYCATGKNLNFCKKTTEIEPKCSNSRIFGSASRPCPFGQFLVGKNCVRPISVADDS